MLKDLTVGVAFGGHNGGSYLTETNSVTPAGTMQYKSTEIAVFIGAFLYNECTAEQV